MRQHVTGTISKGRKEGKKKKHQTRAFVKVTMHFAESQSKCDKKRGGGKRDWVAFCCKGKKRSAGGGTGGRLERPGGMLCHELQRKGGEKSFCSWGKKKEKKKKTDGTQGTRHRDLRGQKKRPERRSEKKKKGKCRASALGQGLMCWGEVGRARLYKERGRKKKKKRRAGQGRIVGAGKKGKKRKKYTLTRKRRAGTIDGAEREKEKKRVARFRKGGGGKK